MKMKRQMFSERLFLMSCVLAFPTLASCSLSQEQMSGQTLGDVVTSDIGNFWEAYDALESAISLSDSVATIQDLYLARGSEGLDAYVRIRVDEPETLLTAVREYPRYLASVRSTMLDVRDLHSIVQDAHGRITELYPEADFPPVYFLYTSFISQGVPTDVGLLIAAEMVSADQDTPLDELPYYYDGVDLTRTQVAPLVAHELIHYQQDYGPGPRLLRETLEEGVAEFVAWLATGTYVTSSLVFDYGDENGAELWQKFRSDLERDPDDVREWLYNGGLFDGPANLGYWMGYQIAEAYYGRSSDKRDAIREMLRIDDPEAFLLASGYDGS